MDEPNLYRCIKVFSNNYDCSLQELLSPDEQISDFDNEAFLKKNDLFLTRLIIVSVSKAQTSSHVVITLVACGNSDI
jgi:hypothetical protein